MLLLGRRAFDVTRRPLIMGILNRTTDSFHDGGAYFRLDDLTGRAEAAGIPSERVMVDPGLDLGKTWRQSVCLLASSELFAGLGYTLLLAPSNKIFLGRLLGLDTSERGQATVAACAIAALRGARVLRMHDARSAVQAAGLVAAVPACDA